jgi:hypothetical protein
MGTDHMGDGKGLSGEVLGGVRRRRRRGKKQKRSRLDRTKLRQAKGCVRRDEQHGLLATYLEVIDQLPKPECELMASMYV